MIRDLKPYPSYRDSGVEWLGEVPEHWGLRSLGSVTASINERDRPDLPLLSVVREKGVVARSTMTDSENHNFIPDDLSNYRVVREGNLVINKMKAWQGSLGIAPMDGIVSPAYFVLDLRIGNRRFGQALLRSSTYVTFFARASDGVRVGQWDLSTHALKRIPVVMPSLAEQSAIVRFLDHMDRRIRHYIRTKQKLIALLHEQRQAIIHRAVTRGLNPDVRLKPSGVEWLGDVPEHWEVVSLRKRWTVTDCKHLTVPFVEEGIPLASVREVQSFDLDLAEAKRTTSNWYEVLARGDRAPRRGDLIYCRNVSVGAAAFVDTDEQFAMGQDVCIIRSQGENQRYLNYFLRGPAMGCQLASLMVGSTFDRINVSEIKELIIAVPPRAEQDAISGYLDESLGGIHKAIAQNAREISLLREYRTRLIADVVTGKLDVREAAVRLPQEAEEPELLDGAGALAEDGAEETEATDLDATPTEAEA